MHGVINRKGIKNMGIIVSDKGLSAAVRDGLKEMDAGADGFSYPIGTVMGNTARLVVEPAGSCEIAYLDDDSMFYIAVDAD